MGYIEELKRAHIERRNRLFVSYPPPPIVIPPKPRPFGIRFARRTSGEIISAVLDGSLVGDADFFSRRRDRQIVMVRHVAMFFLHHCTLMSYPMIGRRLGGKHHTTIMHGVQKVTRNKGFFEPLLLKAARKLRLKLEIKEVPFQ